METWNKSKTFFTSLSHLHLLPHLHPHLHPLLHIVMIKAAVGSLEINKLNIRIRGSVIQIVKLVMNVEEMSNERKNIALITTH